VLGVDLPESSEYVSDAMNCVSRMELDRGFQVHAHHMAKGRLVGAREHTQISQTCFVNTTHQKTDHDAEAMLESHAQWLRSLREQIAQVSHGRTSSRLGRSSFGSGGHTDPAGKPVHVNLGDDRKIVIKVERAGAYKRT
jgi:hypothetical protein